MALPPEFQYGKVVGRVIHAVADSVEDVDALPDARPAAGSITFTPKETLRVVTTAGHRAFVTRTAQKENLSADGVLIDAEGNEGVWLVVGTYDVTFQVTGAKLPALVIEVLADHDEADPLDLVEAVSYTPPSGAVVQTLQVPAGGSDGALLTRSDTTLSWSQMAFVHHGDNANATRPNAVVVFWAGTVEPVNAHPDYDLWVGPVGA